MRILAAEIVIIFILSTVSGYSPPKSPIAPAAETKILLSLSGAHDFGEGAMERIIKIRNLKATKLPSDNKKYEDDNRLLK